MKTYRQLLEDIELMSGSGEVRRKATSKGVRMHKYSSDATDRAMDTYLELRAKKK